MRTSLTAVAVVSTLGLAACACEPETAPNEVVDMDYAMEEMEDYANDSDAAHEPVVVDLDTEYDFGGGFTIRIDDLERRVAEDGFNATTGEEGDLSYEVTFAGPV